MEDFFRMMNTCLHRRAVAFGRAVLSVSCLVSSGVIFFGEPAAFRRLAAAEPAAATAEAANESDARVRQLLWDAQQKREAGQTTEALADLRLADRAAVTHGNFCDAGYAVSSECAFSFDVAFDRATLALLAPKLEAATGCRAFVSFKPPGRWAAAGLTSYELERSARVKTSGEERFTFFLYKRRAV